LRPPSAQQESTSIARDSGPPIVIASSPIARCPRTLDQPLLRQPLPGRFDAIAKSIIEDAIGQTKGRKSGEKAADEALTLPITLDLDLVGNNRTAVARSFQMVIPAPQKWESVYRHARAGFPSLVVSAT
jgi:hypothetical protein